MKKDYSVLIPANTFGSSKQIITKQINSWLNEIDTTLSQTQSQGLFLKLHVSFSLENSESETEKEKENDQEWVCPACNTTNKWAVTFCKFCSTKGPHGGTSVPSLLLSTLDEVEALPPGFPSAPPKVAKFTGDPRIHTEQYKVYMRQKLKYELWQNGLTAYRMREKEHNKEACAQIIEQIKASFAEDEKQDSSRPSMERKVSAYPLTPQSPNQPNPSNHLSILSPSIPTPASDQRKPVPSSSNSQSSPSLIFESLPAQSHHSLSPITQSVLPPNIPSQVTPTEKGGGSDGSTFSLTREYLTEIARHETKNTETDYVSLIKKGINSLLNLISLPLTESSIDMAQVVVPDLKQLLHCLENEVEEEDMDDALTFTLAAGDLISTCLQYMRMIGTPSEVPMGVVDAKKQCYEKSLSVYEMVMLKKEDRQKKKDAAVLILTEMDQEENMLDLLFSLDNQLDHMLKQTKEYSSKEEVIRIIREIRQTLAVFCPEESPAINTFKKKTQELVSASLKMIKSQDVGEVVLDETHLVKALEQYEEAQLCIEGHICTKSKERLDAEQYLIQEFEREHQQPNNSNPEKLEESFWRASTHLSKLDHLFNLIEEIEQSEIEELTTERETSSQESSKETNTRQFPKQWPPQQTHASSSTSSAIPQGSSSPTFSVSHSRENSLSYRPRDASLLRTSSESTLRRYQVLTQRQQSFSFLPRLSAESLSMDIPEGFPPPPLTEEHNKRKWWRYQQWKNALYEYKKKLAEGDTQACQAIIEQYQQQQIEEEAKHPSKVRWMEDKKKNTSISFLWIPYNLKKEKRENERLIEPKKDQIADRQS